MPEPTASELAKEAEREAAVFAQAVNVEKLLNMLRAMDPAKDNLADNEEIQASCHNMVIFDQLTIMSTGTLSIQHGATAEDSQADRQIQSKARFVVDLDSGQSLR